MDALNTQYNKAIYGALAGAITTILVYIAQYYGLVLDTQVQGAITTIITMIVVYAVPNKPVEEESEITGHELPRRKR